MKAMSLIPGCIEPAKQQAATEIGIELTHCYGDSNGMAKKWTRPVVSEFTIFYHNLDRAHRQGIFPLDKDIKWTFVRVMFKVCYCYFNYENAPLMREKVHVILLNY